MRAPIANGTKGTVLVVDDTPDNITFTTHSLRKIGIECLTAQRGWECIEIAKNKPVDLILLDLLMPQMDGWATLAALRDEPATRKIAVVVFSCDDRLAIRERAMKEGAVDFLPRPVMRDALVNCVQTHLRAVARARALEAIDRGLTSSAEMDGTPPPLHSAAGSCGRV
jgi:putative two-component system response regulator